VVQALCDGIDFSVLGERARTPAPGICGGATGKPANFFIRTGEGKEIALRSKASSPRLMQGWELWLETAGGGGYGDDAGEAQGVKARSLPGVEKKKM
jgi:N-methylhydantoinase B/oxoprolinase/acetone carboxylase alpha subunit